MVLPQIVTYTVVKKGMEKKDKLHDASIKAAAGTSREEVTLNSEEIKPIALVVIELRHQIVR